MKIATKVLIRRLFGLKPLSAESFYDIVENDPGLVQSLEALYQEFREEHPEMPQDLFDSLFLQEKEESLRDLSWQLSMWDSFLTVRSAWKMLPHYVGSDADGTPA